MLVNEIFGPSIQGEGIYIGYPSVFLRLTGCSLGCWFCDTKYAFKEGQEISVEDVVDQVKVLLRGSNLARVDLVITGGEPLEQAEEVAEFIDLIRSWRKELRITIETNGHYSLPADFALGRIFWSVSPKLPSSGVYIPFDQLALFSLRKYSQSQWKFVVGTQEDEDILRYALLANDYQNIVIQPCSVEGSLSYVQLIEWAKHQLWTCDIPARVLPQAHVMAWGQKRGV